MHKYYIHPEEGPATEARILELEQQRGFRIPDDYKAFLLQYNGGVIRPDTPRSETRGLGIFPIERLFSIGDLELVATANGEEIMEMMIDDYEDELFELDPRKLLSISLNERGNLLLYCGEDEEFGRVCYANYSGGDGIIKTQYASFTEMMDNLEHFDPEAMKDVRVLPFSENFVPQKIFSFNYYFLWTDQHQEKTLQRFIEVYRFLKKPKEIRDRINERSLMEYYINYPAIIDFLLKEGFELPEKLKRVNHLEAIKHLIEIGGNPEGLLISTRNIDVIKYLIESCGQNINTAYDGKFPMMTYTTIEGIVFRHLQWKLLNQILEAGFDIDYNIQDEKGRTVQDRIDWLRDLNTKKK